jgi:chorismate mutase
MPVRGIRGATVAAANTADAIRSATRELLLALAEANALDPADVASVIFSTTADLTAVQPARAARELGWTDTALMCLAEMPADHGLPRCIRVLIHWNTPKAMADVRHVYLHEATQLRPDRATPLGH